MNQAYVSKSMIQKLINRLIKIKRRGEGGAQVSMVKFFEAQEELHEHRFLLFVVENSTENTGPSFHAISSPLFMN